MDYAIYTFGGGEILWKILNGVAILFKSNNPYFSVTAGLAASISVVIVGMRAIFQGAPMYFIKNWFFPMFILTNIIFGVKTDVHIIDNVDSDHQYSKVSNIPLGLAAIGSLTSMVSYNVTQSLERVFVDQNTNAKYTTSGLLFGARLTSMAKTVVIRDPIMRENIKEYVSRCFMWPFVFTNIEPGKRAALESEDILSFIETNPHPLLGLYWREHNGSSEFVNCSQCTAKVRDVLKVEGERGLSSLAGKIFGKSPDDGQAKRKLLQNFGDGWAQITKRTATASQVIQQQILINAYRESHDDQRDHLGLGRMDGELIALNSARSQAQQNSGLLVKAFLAIQEIPSLHTILFAMSIIFFVIVAPLSLLPDGVKTLFMWMKLMVWICTWPMFYAILEGIGQMFAAKSVESSLIGYAPGLSILTQNLISDTAFDSYCWVQALQLSIPVISWALISQGGYAFSQMASSFTQGIEAGASKAGSEMVDGNTTFDSQTLSYRSVANAQVAQQQLGTSLSYGARFDDGRMATITDTQGRSVHQEHQTQLGANVNTNSMRSQMAGINAQVSEQSGLQYSQSAGKSSQEGIDKMFGLMDTVSRNNTLSETFGTTESAQAQDSLNKAKDIFERFVKDNGVSADRAAQIILRAGATAGVDLEKSMGSGLSNKAGFKLGLSGSGDVNAQFTGRENEMINKAIQSGVGKTFAENFSKGMQYLNDHKGSITDSEVRQGLDQVQAKFSESKFYQEQAANSFNTSKMWSRTAALSEQNSIASSGNKNDPVLSYVANKKFGGDTIMASQWQTSHQNEYLELAGDYMQERKASLGVNNSISMDPGAVKSTFEDNKIHNTIGTSEIDNLKSSSDIGVSQDSLHRGMDSLRGETNVGVDSVGSHMDTKEFDDKTKELHQIHDRSRRKSTIKMARRKLTRGKRHDSIE